MTTKENQEYLDAYQKDKDFFEKYYQKHLANKSEQHKLIEKILKSNFPEKKDKIADFACGSGTLSYHLQELFPASQFMVSDFSESAIELAKKNLAQFNNVTFSIDSVYDIKKDDNSFDIVFMWQTLLDLDKPELAISELTRVCKPGGKIYICSLFNLHHDVDIYTNFLDHTLQSGKEGIFLQYNTISAYTINKWLSGKVTEHKFHEFLPEIDFHYEGRGIGTFTEQAPTRRIQISGGMLMNWAILEITK